MGGEKGGGCKRYRGIQEGQGLALGVGNGVWRGSFKRLHLGSDPSHSCAGKITLVTVTREKRFVPEP